MAGYPYTATSPEIGTHRETPAGRVENSLAERALIAAEWNAAHEERHALPLLVSRIKAECERRILAALPHWKQHNMTARGAELADKQARGSALTDAEEGERAALFAAWDWVKSVRAASDALEVDVAQMTAAQRVAFDPSADSHWPANP